MVQPWQPGDIGYYNDGIMSRYCVITKATPSKGDMPNIHNNWDYSDIKIIWLDTGQPYDFSDGLTKRISAATELEKMLYGVA